MSLRRSRKSTRPAARLKRLFFDDRNGRVTSRKLGVLEYLEERQLLAVDTSNSSSAVLNIFVNGQEVTIPANVGVNANDTTADVFTTNASGKVFFDQGDTVTLGDFFTTWRTNAGLAGNNANAFISSTQLMNTAVSRTTHFQVFVNGQLSNDFENQQIDNGDNIVLVLSSNTVVSMNTNFGSIVIELFDTQTPGTVNNFLNYINDGDYINSFFHRSTTFATAGVAVIQGGGFKTTSTTFASTNQFNQLPTDPPIQNEPGISNLRGTIAMAKTSDPNSATSQFYFNMDDGNSVLDDPDNSGGFTVFGEVLDMTAADAIHALPRSNQGGVFSALPLSSTSQLAVVQSIEGQGEVNGFKFVDADGDGIRDNGEAGVAGVTVWVDANNNGALDNGELSTTTESDGYYELHLEPGTYTIRALVSAGYVTSLPGDATSLSATVEIGGTVSGKNFGESPIPAPAPVDLVAATDTGSASDDNITRFNNSSAGTALQFLVTNVESGSLVKIFANGTLVGSATASGTSVTVTTNGTTTIPDGLIAFTATQTINGSEGPASADVQIRIDSVAPAAITSTAPTLATMNQLFTYDAESVDENVAGMTYSLANAPAGMAIDGDGVVTWTPNSSQTGPVQFQVLLTDTAGNSQSQNVSLTVLGNPPARPDSYSVNEDTTLVRDAVAGVLANDGASGPTGLTATLVAGTTHGTLNLNPDGSFTYTPDNDFFGTDTFTYTTTDGNTTSNVAQVSITVLDTSDPPTGVADSYEVNEDGTLSVNATTGVLSNDTDPDSSTLTAALVNTTANGSLALNEDGSFTYTPNANFFGPDTFTYTVTDGETTSGQITVTITVNPVNDAPTAVNDSYSVNEDATLTVAVGNGVLSNDSDVDGNTLTAVLASQPTHGTLTLNGDGSFTYTPNSNFFGTDSFTYRASDGQSQSDLRTVTINVSAQPDAPTAVNDTFTAPNNGTTQTFNVLANDSSAPDATQTLTITAITQGNNGGTVAINGTSINYTAPVNFSGTDTFTYTITDGDNLPATATVTVTVVDTSANNTISGYVYSDKSLDGVRNSTNAGIPGVLLTLTGTTTAGTSVTRTALTDNNGFYSFANLASGTYKVVQSASTAISDGKMTTSNVSGAVKGQNEISNIVIANGVTLTENNFVEKGGSPGVVKVSWFFASAAQQQVLMREAMAKAAETAGNATLAAAIRDGDTTLDSASASTTSLSQETTTLQTTADSYSIPRNQTLTVTHPGVLENDTDTSGNGLSASLVAAPSQGSASIESDGSLTYTPNSNFSGVDTLTYVATNGAETSAETEVTIIVNSAPQTSDDNYTASEDQPISVDAVNGLLANDSDEDADTLTTTLVTAPQHGTVELAADGSFTYTPEENFNGVDTLQVRVEDNYADALATVSIQVSAVNDAPVATADEYQLAVDGTLSVDVATGLLANDFDVDEDELLAALVSGPSNGSLSFNADGSFSYTPNTGFTGSDSFRYQVTDGLLSSEAEVTLDVLTEDLLDDLLEDALSA